MNQKVLALFLAIFVHGSASEGLPPDYPREVNVTCEFGVDQHTNLYTCSLRRGRLLYADQVLVIVGEHLPGFGDGDVRAVTHYFGVQLTFLGGDILQRFPNVEVLGLQFTRIGVILPTAFATCHALRSLTITHTDDRLTTLPPGMLRNCRNLRSFFHQTSHVAALPNDLFGTAPSLESFTFTNSHLTTLPERLFLHSRDLRHVFVQNNRIDTLHRSTFMNVQRLETFNLNFNRLARQADLVEAIGGQAGLRTLRFWQNQLDSFDFNLLRQRFVGLEVLQMSARNITGVAWSAFPASLVELRVLGINEEIPENALYNLINLRHLMLAGDIRHFYPNTFANQRRLEVLELSGCHLTAVHADLFRTLVNLRRLDLGGNAIEELPAGVFASLVNLDSHLTLWENRLRRLNADSFGIHPNLTQMTVSFNRLYAIEREIFVTNLPNLRHLGVSENECADVFVSDNIADRPELEYCFANWRGETTSTTTEGGALKNGGGFLAGLLGLLLVFLLGGF